MTDIENARLGAPAVTFVIPAHNAEATIAQTLHCLVRQTRSDWCTIIVDDGSTDRTAEIAARFLNDQRFSLVHKPCGGVASARNFGARLAGSRWLVFLDSDDLIAPDYLAEMLAAAGDAPDAVYCSGLRLAPDGRMAAMEQPPHSHHLLHLRSRNVFFTHAVMLSREVFDGLEGFQESLRTCEDWDLWRRLFQAGARVVGIDKRLAIYRMRPGSLTRDAASLLQCSRTVIARAYAEAEPDPTLSAEAGAVDLAHKMQESILCVGAWIFGVTVGTGSPDSAMLGPCGQLAKLGADTFAICLIHGAAVGACQFPSDWPRLWPALRGTIQQHLSTYSAACVAPLDAGPYLARLAELAVSSEIV